MNVYDQVMSALATWDWHPHQRSASSLMREFGTGPGVLVVLIDALQHEEWVIRERAAYVLGEIRDRRAVRPLQALLDDPRAVVRFHAVYALEKIGDPRALDSLLAALDDPDGDVRYRAAASLGSIGDRRAIAPLIAALEDSKNHVQHSAARALGCLGDHRAIEPLQIFLDDLQSQADVSPRLISTVQDSLAQLLQPVHHRAGGDCHTDRPISVGLDSHNWSTDS